MQRCNYYNLHKSLNHKKCVWYFELFKIRYTKNYLHLNLTKIMHFNYQLSNRLNKRFSFFGVYFTLDTLGSAFSPRGIKNPSLANHPSRFCTT
ncbi:hypothetical protein M301_1775 [Methylotenera versatilis 301]|uniref:Uncharacterized protein n=1 Tax=Methylotenera versatilis (strain 301) TaxID=666681 RepID=D7DJB7_METV0|nr:hypothetical protein M301_1775 [Methylotenera versatilis 301]